MRAESRGLLSGNKAAVQAYAEVPCGVFKFRHKAGIEEKGVTAETFIVRAATSEQGCTVDPTLGRQPRHL